MPTFTRFVSYCPLGHLCGRGYRRLGAFATEEEAREKAKWHMMNTACNHGDLPDEEAQQRADDMVLDSEEIELEDESSGKSAKEPKGSGKGKGWHGSKGKGKGKSSWWEPSDSSRSEPYALQIAARPQPTMDLTGPIAECIEALTRSESSARAAARVAHQAAVSFDDEAAILHMTLDKLQNCVKAMDTMVRKS